MKTGLFAKIAEFLAAKGISTGAAIAAVSVGTVAIVGGVTAGVILLSSPEEAPPQTHEHSFTSYISDNNAMPGEDGTKTAKCDGCDVTDTVTDIGSSANLNYTEGLEFDFYENPETSETSTTYAVVGFGTADPETIHIPPTYNGVAVTGIDLNVSTAYAIKTISLPSSIEFVSEDSFVECYGIKKLMVSKNNKKFHSSGNCLIETETKTLRFGNAFSTIPSDGSVTAIGDAAFGNCINLKSIDIPDTVESIGVAAFAGCENLKSIKLPNGLKSIGATAFFNCGSLISIDIPDSVTKIELAKENSHIENKPVFYDCFSLVKATVGKGLTDTSIPLFANNPKLEIYNKSSLTFQAINVYTPESGESKMDFRDDGYIFFNQGETVYLMAYTGNDTRLILPENYNGKSYEIYMFAFYGNNVTSVVIPSGVTAIGEMAFESSYHSSKRLVEIYNKSSLNIEAGSEDNGGIAKYALNVYTPESGESKMDYRNDGYVFYKDGENVQLITYAGTGSELTLPENYNGNSYSIYPGAFAENYDITNVKIPGSVKNVDGFAYCKTLEKVEIGYGVETISNSAFYYCENLRSISIPDSVKSIGKYAFHLCKSLKSVDLGNGIKIIDNSAFELCQSLNNITIPESVKMIGQSAFENDNLSSIIFADTSNWYKTSTAEDWENKTGGTAGDVSDPEKNTKYDFYSYYWYKN